MCLVAFLIHFNPSDVVVIYNTIVDPTLKLAVSLPLSATNESRYVAALRMTRHFEAPRAPFQKQGRDKP